MKRTLSWLVATSLWSTLVAHADAAPDPRRARTHSCQVAKAERRSTDGTVRSLHADAERGDAEAMNALAVMYAQGTGVAKNSCMAKSLFERSAAQGYVPAMVNLGMLHALSDNLRRDGGQAYAWVRAALYVGVADEERDATVFKLGMIAGRLDVAQVERAEALARRIASSVALKRAPSVEKIREPVGVGAPT